MYVLMSKTPPLILILGLTAGCSQTLQTASNGDSLASNPVTKPAIMSAEYACEPVTGNLDTAATFSDRAGRYLITMLSEATDSSGAAAHTVSGLLTLRRQAHSSDSQDPQSDVTTPLYGFTDIDPRPVGAHRVGDPGSEDPSAPGVLVIEREEYGRRIITLRLGSDANRKDLVRYDGEYTVMSVRRIDEEGFAGNWRSGGGLGFSVTTGYFCAWKAP